MCTSVNIQYYSLTARSLLYAVSYLRLTGWGLFSSVKPSVKPSVKRNSIGVERHFIFDAWTCALQINLILLFYNKGEGMLCQSRSGCFVFRNELFFIGCLSWAQWVHWTWTPHINSMAQSFASLEEQETANEIHFLFNLLPKKKKKKEMVTMHCLSLKNFQ